MWVRELLVSAGHLTWGGEAECNSNYSCLCCSLHYMWQQGWWPWWCFRSLGNIIHSWSSTIQMLANAQDLKEGNSAREVIPHHQRYYTNSWNILCTHPTWCLYCILSIYMGFHGLPGYPCFAFQHIPCLIALYFGGWGCVWRYFFVLNFYSKICTQ